MLAGDGPDRADRGLGGDSGSTVFTTSSPPTPSEPGHDAQASEDDRRYAQRILDEYARQRPLYEEYCASIFKLLDLILKERGLRYQISSRTKAPDQLREKLLRKAGQGVRYAQLSDIEDLAGLRVIFYTERDKNRFLVALGDEISGPMRVEERSTRSGYDATHAIVSLGPRRLQLSEYRRFEGMKCEIQVTTILRHAWAEIEHDLVYKDVNGLKTRDPERYARLQERLGDVMDRYIRRAGDELELILAEFEAARTPPDD